jgi:hypothetical protein
LRRSLLIMVLGVFILPLFAQTYPPIPDFYHRYDDMVDQIFDWQLEYPDIVMVELIGYSQEDEIPIYAVKVSNDVQDTEDKPRILVIGSLHAEEIIGNEIVMNHMQEILNRRFQLPFRRWLNDLELWFVPNLNPEGLQVVMDDLDVTYRKNKRDNNENGQFDYIPGMGNDLDGVDLNRNFPFNWVHGDTLWHPGGTEPYDYYCGPDPASESETQAIMAFAEEHKFVYSIIWHSSRSGLFSEKVYYPFAFGDIPNRRSPDFLLSQTLGNGVAGEIRNFANDGFYQSLPSTGRNGNADDWFYQALGTLQLLIEAGTANLQPQSYDDLMSVVDECIKGQSWLFNRALNGYQDVSPMLTGKVTDAVTGEPLVAEIIVHEHHARYFEPRYTEPVYGRYWRPLQAGLYTVTARKRGYEPLTHEAVAVNNSGWRNRHFSLQPLPETTFTGTILLEGEPVDAEIVLTDFYEDVIEVQDGSFSFSTYPGVKTIKVTAEGAYPYIGELILQPGEHDIYVNLGEEHMIFFEDFQSSCCQFIYDDPWQVVFDEDLDKLVLWDSYDGGYNFYAPNADESITTDFPINLVSYEPPHYQTPYLVFWQNLYTEWDHDFVWVQASTDLEEWTTLYKESGRFDYWHPVHVSLEPVVGQEVYLRFRLTADSPGDLTRFTDPGWILADIKIVAGNTEFTSVDEETIETVQPVVRLHPNYPNPFNPVTNFSFTIANTVFSKAEIVVYNIKGGLVDRIELEKADVKRGSVAWNAGNRPSGVYFYQLLVDYRLIDSNKAVLIK